VEKSPDFRAFFMLRRPKKARHGVTVLGDVKREKQDSNWRKQKN